MVDCVSTEKHERNETKRKTNIPQCCTTHHSRIVKQDYIVSKVWIYRIVGAFATHRTIGRLISFVGTNQDFIVCQVVAMCGGQDIFVGNEYPAASPIMN